MWTAPEFLAAVEGKPDGELPGDVTGVSMDSRTIAPGEAFFAITGDRFDGHKFAGAALKNGACVAVVGDKFERGDAAGALVRVDDPLAAMGRLARAARTRSTGRIIAVTGSVGKTGTKRALALALEPSGATHASPASFNNHWGVPFSLANLARDAKFGVFEIGMNHAGEITPLTKLVRPHVAIITTIAPVHIGYLGSIEAIADAKAEIFAGLEAGGTAVLNRDNDQYDRLAHQAREAGAQIIGFGADERAEARLLRQVPMAGGSIVDADILGDQVTYKLGTPGRHLVMNSLAVLAAVKLVGADLALGALRLSEWRALAGRGEQTTLRAGSGDVLLIDESYNANPASMRAALAVLGETQPGPRGRRIAVIGDMLELGDDEAAAHRQLAEPIIESGVDLVFACGPAMRDLYEAVPTGVRGGFEETADALKPRLVDAVGAGDVIMVKGSFAIGMGAIAEELKQRYPSADSEEDG
ncbi:MAG: UDP-N-acetylmuramoylalanyl-D-glutamyl-2,6-diaminopimelate--D-alanyl-D-alanine ligase [Rhizobiales bacterium]|nr:UDP-N-acetylmuramoylalanyl-D-glutamyl-2,6-diaminopimelate--D-alanyl-D-alanine ligase [Hyphomicrobiales bacterium]